MPRRSSTGSDVRDRRCRRCRSGRLVGSMRRFDHLEGRRLAAAGRSDEHADLRRPASRSTDRGPRVDRSGYFLLTDSKRIMLTRLSLGVGVDAIIRKPSFFGRLWGGRCRGKGHAGSHDPRLQQTGLLDWSWVHLAHRRDPHRAAPTTSSLGRRADVLRDAHRVPPRGARDPESGVRSRPGAGHHRGPLHDPVVGGLRRRSSPTSAWSTTTVLNSAHGLHAPDPDPERGRRTRLGGRPTCSRPPNGMGMSRTRRLFLVEIPLATPTIFAGIRIATVTLIGLVPITRAVRVGRARVTDARTAFQIDFNTPITVGVVLTLLLAVVVDVLLLGVQKLITPVGRVRRSGRELPWAGVELVPQRRPLDGEGRASPNLTPSTHRDDDQRASCSPRSSPSPSGSGSGTSSAGGFAAINVSNFGPRVAPRTRLLLFGVTYFGIGDPPRGPHHHRRQTRSPSSSPLVPARHPRRSLTNTYVGVSGRRRGPARNRRGGMGMSGVQSLRKVELPIALPPDHDGDPHRGGGDRRYPRRSPHSSTAGGPRPVDRRRAGRVRQGRACSRGAFVRRRASRIVVEYGPRGACSGWSTPKGLRPARATDSVADGPVDASMVPEPQITTPTPTGGTAP